MHIKSDFTNIQEYLNYVSRSEKAWNEFAYIVMFRKLSSYCIHTS
jgi:hypothetical protein